jgi:hypothetical protein
MSTRTENPSRLVISQPMFLPWLGMFEQIGLCDQFVFYDDVQLPLGGGRGRGFSTRVQIKTEKGIDWLTLPVERAGKGAQLISEARFANMDWKSAHLSKITQAYRAAPFFAPVYESLVAPIYAQDTGFLSEFCMVSMQKIWLALGLSPAHYVSSQLKISQELNSSLRVLEICKAMGAGEYISGLGAMKYIDYTIFEEAGVRIAYMDYALKPYPQLHGEFTPYVSIIDMLFCIGIEATAAAIQSKQVYWKDWPNQQDGRPVN